MASAKIRKIKLIIPRENVATVLCELMLLGCVEISEPDELLEDPELSALVKREESELEACRLDYSSLERGLDIIDTYVTDEPEGPETKPEISLEKLLYETYPESSLMLAKSLETLDGMMLILPAEDHAEIVTQIKAAGDQRESLKLSSDHYNIRILLAEAVEKLLGTDCTLMLSGWAPSKSESELTQMLSQHLCAWEFCDPGPEEQHNVPVALRSTKLFGKFQKEAVRQFKPFVIRTKYVNVIRG